MGSKKGFFTSHSKSSAAVVTLIVHAVLIAIAFFLVAVTVIRKDDVDFAAKPVSRPKMNLRKLQVPVNTRKPPQQPKLRRQIVVKPNITRITPDIKMPEIVGVKGGVGAAGSSLGGGVALGFSMPEIDFFGVKGKSEKILLILDGGRGMSSDSLGGAYGYEVIKKECLRLIDGLPSTAVFNIVVYDGDKANQLFQSMESAGDGNVQKAKDWLLPLNQVIGAKTRYGLRTLGPGGTGMGGEYPFGKFEEDLFYPRAWNMPVMQAMRQQADTVFLLTSSWGSYMYFEEDPKEYWAKWYETSDGRLFKERADKGRKLLDEENRRRKEAGEPPRALNRNSDRSVVRAYFPGTKEPPNPPHKDLGVKDFVEAFRAAYKAYSREAPKLGIKKKSKSRFKLNVIFFKQDKFKDEKSQKYSDLHEQNFSNLAKSLDGECRSVAGLAAIKSYVDPSSLDD